MGYVSKERILEESGVFYTFNKEDGKGLGYIEFNYKTLHIPTGKEIENQFYTTSWEKALALVNHWNRTAEWKYHLL